jgi:iron(III) transport system ATP-binding protein
MVGGGKSAHSEGNGVPALAISGAVRRFGARVAVDQVSLELRTGELVAILGPSGSGKTTLLRLVAGFDVPDEGTVAIAGRLVAGDGAWVEPEHRGVGLVPQGDSLFPHLSVAENVAFGIGRDVARVAEVLELVGLRDRADSDPAELSGGERQRVAVARALAPRPALTLLDEPFSSLDAALRSRLRADVAEVLRTAGATALWVTHDQEEALSLADRVVVMRQGRVLQAGTPAEVYWAPVDAWTAGFLGELNVVPGTVEGESVATTLGRFELSGSAPAHAGSSAVGLRPEAIGLEPAEGARAHIRARAFRGRDVLYEVDDPELGTIHVQTPSFDVLDVGSSVRLFPVAGSHAIPLPAGEVAVAAPSLP